MHSYVAERTCVRAMSYFHRSLRLQDIIPAPARWVVMSTRSCGKGTARFSALKGTSCVQAHDRSIYEFKVSAISSDRRRNPLVYLLRGVKLKLTLGIRQKMQIENPSARHSYTGHTFGDRAAKGSRYSNVLYRSDLTAPVLKGRGKLL
jgi:hypothetical protein